MPTPGVALFVRPLFDTPTAYGHYYMNIAAQYAARNMHVVDLEGAGATKANIFAMLEEKDPIFCYWNGHGNADTFTAQNKVIVMQTCSGDEVLRGRVVLLFSCSCGIRLAPDAVQKGALTVFAWTVDFSWWAAEDPDPATDPYALGHFESVNAISDALADGKTTQEAMNQSLASWNGWIEYWMGSDDSYASLVIQSMIHNRDGQKLFGSTSARISAPELEPMGGLGLLALAWIIMEGGE